MAERIWHSGPPPHVGWWNASTMQNPNVWRWWNGKHWSWAALDSEAPSEVAGRAKTPAAVDHHPIFWCDYYPKNARVPRINPEQAND